MKITSYFAALSLICTVLAAILTHHLIYLDNNEWLSVGSIFRVSGVFILLSMSAVILHIMMYEPADSHSVSSLLTQYLFQVISKLIGHFQWKQFCKSCKSPAYEQEKLLMQTIRENTNTTYGKEHNFHLIRTREDFVQQHPLTDYDHYESYVERTCSGEANVMSPKKLEYVAMTSGTSGSYKKIPIFEGFRINFMVKLSFFIAFISRKLTSLKRVISIRHKPRERRTPQGIQMGGSSYHLTGLPSYALTPLAAGSIEDEQTQLYVTALFALAEREVAEIDGILSSMVYAFFQKIEQRVYDLCDDIRNGCLSVSVEVDQKVRDAVNTALKPDRQRAEEVMRQVKLGANGLGRRLWPDLELAAMATTGVFEAYTHILSKSYLQGVFCKGYLHIASEAIVGVVPEGHIDASQSSQQYAMTPSTIFYEFIPIESAEEDNPKTVFIDQVQVGSVYEVVVTNCHGLYRYRLGDVIKIVGFLLNNPVYEFQYRAGQVLTVATEKTSDKTMYQSLVAAEKKWKGKTIADYTATEAANFAVLNDCRFLLSSTNSYCIFIELQKDQLLTQAQKDLIDNELRSLSPMYDAHRKSCLIAPMQVFQVESGTFQEMKLLTIRDTNNQQYKTPRALRKTELLALLIKKCIQENQIDKRR